MVQEVDPFTFEIVRHRLFKIVDEASLTLKMVSGSHVTNEAHDLMVALYTDKGGLLTAGMGFLHHLIPASRAVKRILERFAGEIYEDDMFLLNDAYKGALHAPDIYIIAPIHFDAEIVAFAANFVHVTDIGAIDAGGFCPRAESSYQEGFQTPGLKIIERDKLRDDIIDTILNMSRDPELTGLDIRSQIAANQVAKRRLKETLEEFGKEDTLYVCRELIKMSDSAIHKRLLELPDGQWCARQYVYSPKEGKLFRINLKMIKRGDSLLYDFDGTSEQSKVGINSSYITTLGGIFAPFLPLLCWDVVWNEGLEKAITLRVPEGTIMNCTRPAPVSIATIGTLQTANILSHIVISKMLGSSEKYADRASGVWHGDHSSANQWFIKDKNACIIQISTEQFSGAGGGRAFKDGIDFGGEIPNVVSRVANVERVEGDLPLLCLFRDMASGTGGAGEYRGGVSIQHAYTPIKPLNVEISLSTMSKGNKTPFAEGLFGGYLGSITRNIIFKGVPLWNQKGFLTPFYGLDELQELRVEEIDASWGVFDLKVGDVYYVKQQGSGGYGDPLDRDPDKVIEDVSNDFVSRRVAERIYGVVLSENGKLDLNKTVSLRKKIREERLRKTEGLKPRISSSENLRPTGFRLGKLLVMESEEKKKYYVCGKCKEVIAPIEKFWKENAIIDEEPLHAIDNYREAHRDLRFRKFVCPNCGTMLDSEIALPGDPYLEDKLFG